MSAFLSLARRLALGADKRQQLRASQALMVLAIYAVFAVVQHLEVMLGMIDAAESWALTTFNLAGGVGFYACIRSGLNLRLKRGQALTIPQSLWAIVGIGWSYAITGPARGVVILIMVVVVVYGMFDLSPRLARSAALLAFTVLASVMIYKAHTDPARYDPRVEAMHLVFAGIVMAVAYQVTRRVAHMRMRLQEQRTELADALQRIQALATVDVLTGLTNRRAAMDRMRDELCVRGRPEPLMSLVVMDIDHFKLVNDGHGHAAGDAVLRRFADCAAACIRSGDVLARWGGEEFLLMMPASTPSQAQAATERLRQALQGVFFDDIAPGLRVTFSAGVSPCTGPADLDTAIARADMAMYRAKQGGRDRTVVCEQAGPDAAAATVDAGAPSWVSAAARAEAASPTA